MAILAKWDKGREMREKMIELWRDIEGEGEKLWEEREQGRKRERKIRERERERGGKRKRQSEGRGGGGGQ
jgi:hypothetical protein